MATIPEARPSTGRDRERQVRRIFSEIAPRYDLLNHVLSLNVDRAWRRRAVGSLGWQNAPEGTYLDACAGTCDLGLELDKRAEFRGRVVATDFAWPMLHEARGKVTGAPIRRVCGDTLRLPFPDAVFDGAMVAFGIRNLSDLSTGFHELRRVLKPGARLVILEFTMPPNPLVRTLYGFYFHRILPRVGRLVSGHPWAYSYLPASVSEFPSPEELADMLEEAGFETAAFRLLTLGIAALHVGTAGKS
jgi:demethylmenaquinone methyltransferase/2-methoxy-6-polyprenyl-1,4-benzoquinol methylase